jgi:hypothetical protein
MRIIMSIRTLGVDLGKFSCHVIGQDQQGKIIEKRKIPLSMFAEYLANLPALEPMDKEVTSQQKENGGYSGDGQ